MRSTKVAKAVNALGIRASIEIEGDMEFVIVRGELKQYASQLKKLGFRYDSDYKEWTWHTPW